MDFSTGDGIFFAALAYLIVNLVGYYVVYLRDIKGRFDNGRVS
jgi:hypothetical protein